MKSCYLVVMLVLTALLSEVKGQDGSYLQKSWKEVSMRMPDAWYATAEAMQVAENVLICQKEVGGWAKNIPYHQPLSQADKSKYLATRNEVGATIDNGATTMELRFLAKVYTCQPDERLRDAFFKGIKYILAAQYENGGWPQFYPLKSVDHYSSHITYNDNAMVNVMLVLRDLYEDSACFRALKSDPSLRQDARAAFEKGVTCILKTQIRVDGELTVWCAQHDEHTFEPANARAYELASFSGAESADIVKLLMDIDSPTPEVIAAVNGAVSWFEKHRIEGIRLKWMTNSDGERDCVVVNDQEAPHVWARFYDLDTEAPYFCDRDGIKRSTLAEVGFERRTGYGWYTYAPAKILNDYADWLNKWVK